MNNDSQDKLNSNRLKNAIDGLSLRDFESSIKDKPWNEHNRDALVWAFRTSAKLIFKHGADDQKIQDREMLFSRAVALARAHDDEDVAKEIERIKNSAVLIEQLYGDILSGFEKSAIASLPPERRFSACLQRACEQWNEVRLAVEAAMLNNKSNVVVLHHQGIKVQLKGMSEPVSADQLQATSMSSLWSNLNMLAHTNEGWVDGNGVFVFPEPASLQPGESQVADATFDLSGMWYAWQRTEESFRYLEGDFELLEANSLKGEIPEHITHVLKYVPTESEQNLHRLAVVANQRFSALLFQNFVEMTQSTNIASLAKGIANPLELIPNGHVSEEEVHAAVMLSQVLGFGAAGDESTYGGLRIVEWLRGYATLKQIARDRVVTAASDLLITLSRDELVEVLNRVGLHSDKAERFILAATLKRSSRDLFDAPLLKLRGEKYLLIGPTSSHTVLPSVLMSVFSNAQYDIEKKGEAFQASIIKFLEKQGLEAKTITTTIDREVYDYDVVFIWGDYLFWFECKNRSMPGTSAVERYYYYERNLRGHIRQVKRLAKALEVHPEILVREFGEDVSGKTIVPCVLNSLPFSMLGKIDEMYFSDASIVRRFFEEPTINIKMKVGDKNGSPVVIQVPMVRLWDKMPTPEDFIRQLDRSAQVVAYMKGQHIEETIVDVGGELAFIISNIYQHPLTPDSAKEAFRDEF